MDFDLDEPAEEASDMGGVMGAPLTKERTGEGAERLELVLSERRDVKRPPVLLL